MNSNPKAQRSAPKKKKKPLVQRVAIGIVKLSESSAKKKTPSKHAVKGDVNQRTRASSPQRESAQNKRKAPPRQNAAQRNGTPQRNGAVRPQQTVKGRPAGQRISMSAKAKEQARKKRLIMILKLRKQLMIAGAVLVFVIIMLILSRTVFFKIDNIVVTNPGDVSYTSDQIVKEIGIVPGTQNLFGCDTEKAEKNLEQRLPFIGEAVVEKDFPSTLRVTVTPTAVSAAVIHGGGYLLLSETGKLLQYTDMAPEGVPTLRCAFDIKAEPGQYLGMVSELNEDGEETNPERRAMDLFSSILSKANESGLIGGLSLIDIRDERALTLMYENRLTLHFGNASSLEDKFRMAAEIIAREDDSAKTRTGAIDLSTVGVGYSIDTHDTHEDITEQTTEANE